MSETGSREIQRIAAQLWACILCPTEHVGTPEFLTAISDSYQEATK